jgi:hypothetical protein
MEAGGEPIASNKVDYAPQKIYALKIGDMRFRNKVDQKIVINVADRAVACCGISGKRNLQFACKA